MTGEESSGRATHRNQTKLVAAVRERGVLGEFVNRLQFVRRVRNQAVRIVILAFAGSNVAVGRVNHSLKSCGRHKKVRLPRGGER